MDYDNEDICLPLLDQIFKCDGICLIMMLNFAHGSCGLTYNIVCSRLSQFYSVVGLHLCDDTLVMRQGCRRRLAIFRILAH